MLKRILIMVIILVIVFGGIFYSKHYMMNKYVEPMLNRKMPPTLVSTVPATAQTWTPSLSAVGTLVAVHGVDVSPEVAGTVQSINFESGQMVKKGDLLVQLDTAVDQENLKKLEAQLSLDKSNYERYKSIYDTKVISASDMQKMESTYKQSDAAANSQKALIAEKSIRAPFAGKVGIRKVNLGQYVSPGTVVVGLQSLDPLYVNFSLPEQNIPSISNGQNLTVSSADQPSDSGDSDIGTGAVQVNTTPQTIPTYDGHIIAIDSSINKETRTVLVQAIVPNPKHALLPGAFVQVNVMLPVQQKVITIPQTAVTYTLYGNTVYVVKDDKGVKTAVPVTVQTGAKKGDVVAITSGIKEGDLVVTDGQVKLHPGSEVVLKK